MVLFRFVGRKSREREGGREIWRDLVHEDFVAFDLSLCVNLSFIIISRFNIDILSSLTLGACMHACIEQDGGRGFSGSVYAKEKEIAEKVLP